MNEWFLTNGQYINYENINKLWRDWNLEWIKNNKVIGFYQDKRTISNVVDKECCSNFYKHHKIYYIIPKWGGMYAGHKVTCEFTEKLIMLIKASLNNNSEMWEKIKDAKTPFECKMLGRQITPFDEKLWHKYVVDIAVDVVWCKFSQVDSLVVYLLNSKDVLFAEATKRDKIWGIGLNKDENDVCYPERWKGKNILGFALMYARARITNGNYYKMLL